MDLEEAEKLLNTPWILQCGHTSDAIKDDYYSSWCGKCGTLVDRKTDLPERRLLALKITNKAYNDRKASAKLLRESVLKTVDKFLKYKPDGTEDEFYNYIITTK